MKKPLFSIVFCLGFLPLTACAQATVPSAPGTPGMAATTADMITGTAPAGVSLAPETPVANPTALKVKAEVNPITNKLNVRADASGPMRIEINDNGGRPVLTKNVLVGTKAAELNVSQLPAGTYVVRCTAGEKTGTRLVRLGL